MKKVLLVFLATMLFVGLGLGTAYAGPENSERTCTDGKDNDKDDLIDCADPDCAAFCGGGCTEGATQPTTCGVGACEGNTGIETCDANGNWINDTCDPFAGAAPDDATCDGIDDDCDGSVDEDGSCGGTCANYTDKGLCNEDPNCEWIGNPRNGSCQDIACTPSTEGPYGDPTCSDGQDNDCDTLTDAADPDCDPGCTPSTEGPFGDPTCSDGQDNDCDTLTDSADPDCQQAANCNPLRPEHDGLLFANYPNNCISCHDNGSGGNQYAHIGAAVHYQWVGDTPYMDNQGGTLQGKLTNGVNSYCINILGDWPICGKCHVGRGLSPDDPAADNTNIDCLVCHNAEYAAARDRIGSGPGSMTVASPNDCMVQEVHLPVRSNCLKCHATAGGGDGVKRGDLSLATATNADANFDVHMNTSGANYACQDCHTYSNHKVAGKGSDLRPTDLDVPVTCTTADCHAGKDTVTGHSSSNRTVANFHIARVSCQACHIPVYGKEPTETDRNWWPEGHSDTGVKPFHPSHTMESNLTPKHKFWNGRSDNYLLGDTAVIDPKTGNYPTSRPMPDDGNGANHALGETKLYAFKYKTATQPMANDGKLVALDTLAYIGGGQTADAATIAGMVNMGYSNPTTSDFSQVVTDTYQMLNHGVSPAANVDCGVCHGDLNYTDISALDAEGYMLKDDPALICAQCHREKNFKRDQEGMHNHIDKSGGLDCLFCHTFSRKAERGENWCDPSQNGPGECAEFNGSILDGPVCYDHGFGGCP